MIKHIVVWRLLDSAHGSNKRENAVQIKQRLESLQGVVPGLIAIEVGIDFSGTPDSGDVVLYSDFENREALDAYQAHPMHKEIMPFIMAARSERRMVDYEV